MTLQDRMNDPEFVAAARALWDDGKTLGEIAAQLDCSIYDLSPWIYQHAIDEALGR